MCENHENDRSIPGKASPIQTFLLQRIFWLDRRVRNLRERILGPQWRLAPPLGKQLPKVAGLAGLSGNGLDDEPGSIPPDPHAISWKLQLGRNAHGLAAAVAEELGFAGFGAGSTHAAP